MAGSSSASAAAAHLLCVQEAPAGLACRGCRGTAGPIPPGWLLCGRDGEAPVEILAGSLDLAVRGDTKSGYHLSFRYF